MRCTSMHHYLGGQMPWYQLWVAVVARRFIVSNHPSPFENRSQDEEPIERSCGRDLDFAVGGQGRGELYFRKTFPLGH